MTPMYFFMIILFFTQLCYGVSLKYQYSPGKYQIQNTEITGTCNYHYFMSFETNIVNTGNDYRYPHDENTHESVPYFAKIIHQQHLLIALQNENDSLINKQLLIEEHNKNEMDYEYDNNIFASGLMMDWDVNIM